MRKFRTIGCAYLLIFCMPLHLMAYTSSNKVSIAGVAAPELSKNQQAGEILETNGPGKRKKRVRHKKRQKLMGKHKNLSDRANGGIFGKGKKKDGTGQHVLFMIVPAVAVAGLAVLFVFNTNQKNSEPEQDLTGTN